MITISLCLIVKNEEKNLNQCLKSIEEAVDEIIIVDTGSNDSTKEIAKRFTSNIFDFKWVDDFSAARNFAFSKATKQYIMWLDADDILLESDKLKLLALKEKLDPNVDAVMMKYNISHDSEGNTTFSFFRERLVKKERNFVWKEPVHEYIEINGKNINSDICITHTKTNNEKSNRNLKIYEKFVSNRKKLSIRGMFYFARELKENKKHKQAINWFKAFLKTKKGWVEDNISANRELAECYFLTNQEQKGLNALFASFEFDKPRAETCCRIGYYFKNKNNFELAAFWFETASNLEKPKESWGFIQNDFWDYIPLLECSVCFDRIGDHEKAEAFNEKAAHIKPNSKAVKLNKKYFEALKQKT